MHPVMFCVPVYVELVVGLDRDSYSVLEGQEFANITVNMVGRATRNIVVLVQTMDGTAVCKYTRRETWLLIDLSSWISLGNFLK